MKKTTSLGAGAANAEKAYHYCEVCADLIPLTYGKIQHVVAHLPASCAGLCGLSDNQCLAWFMACYGTATMLRLAPPFEGELTTGEVLEEICGRELSPHLERLLRRERSLIGRKTHNDKFKRPAVLITGPEHADAAVVSI